MISTKNVISFLCRSVRLSTKATVSIDLNSRIISYSKCALLNKRLCTFSTNANTQPFFVFSSQSQPDFLKLQLQYRSKQDATIFQDCIKSCSTVLDQMNIFKIFKVMQTSPYNSTSYQIFYDYIEKHIKRKSDNMRLLMATIKEKIAKNYLLENKHQFALQFLEEALDVLESSLVPPLFPYYSIYRQYGLVHAQIGQNEKAKQILIQSVDILDDFVSHSDDNVSSNDYCRKQATAYNILARVDRQNRSKWIKKANDMWEKFAQNRFNQIEYAKTVAENLKLQLKGDKEKGQAFYHFNMYKFQNKEFKQILKKAKLQTEQQK